MADLFNPQALIDNAKKEIEGKINGEITKATGTLDEKKKAAEAVINQYKGIIPDDVLNTYMSSTMKQLEAGAGGTNLETPKVDESVSKNAKYLMIGGGLIALFLIYKSVKG